MAGNELKKKFSTSVVVACQQDPLLYRSVLPFLADNTMQPGDPQCKQMVYEIAQKLEGDPNDELNVFYSTHCDVKDQIVLVHTLLISHMRLLISNNDEVVSLHDHIISNIVRLLLLIVHDKNMDWYALCRKQTRLIIEENINTNNDDNKSKSRSKSRQRQRQREKSNKEKEKGENIQLLTEIEKERLNNFKKIGRVTLDVVIVRFFEDLLDLLFGLHIHHENRWYTDGMYYYESLVKQREKQRAQQRQFHSPNVRNNSNSITNNNINNNNNNNNNNNISDNPSSLNTNATEMEHNFSCLHRWYRIAFHAWHQLRFELIIREHNRQLLQRLDNENKENSDNKDNNNNNNSKEKQRSQRNKNRSRSKSRGRKDPKLSKFERFIELDRFFEHSLINSKYWKDKNSCSKDIRPNIIDIEPLLERRRRLISKCIRKIEEDDGNNRKKTRWKYQMVKYLMSPGKMIERARRGLCYDILDSKKCIVLQNNLLKLVSRLIPKIQVKFLSNKQIMNKLQILISIYLYCHKNESNTIIGQMKIKPPKYLTNKHESSSSSSQINKHKKTSNNNSGNYNKSKHKNVNTNTNSSTVDVDIDMNNNRRNMTDKQGLEFNCFATQHNSFKNKDIAPLEFLEYSTYKNQRLAKHLRKDNQRCRLEEKHNNSNDNNNNNNNNKNSYSYNYNYNYDYDDDYQDEDNSYDDESLPYDPDEFLDGAGGIQDPFGDSSFAGSDSDDDNNDDDSSSDDSSGTTVSYSEDTSLTTINSEPTDTESDSDSDSDDDSESSGNVLNLMSPNHVSKNIENKKNKNTNKNKNKNKNKLKKQATPGTPKYFYNMLVKARTMNQNDSENVNETFEQSCERNMNLLLNFRLARLNEYDKINTNTVENTIRLIYLLFSTQSLLNDLNMEHILEWIITILNNPLLLRSPTLDDELSKFFWRFGLVLDEISFRKQFCLEHGNRFISHLFDLWPKLLNTTMSQSLKCCIIVLIAKLLNLYPNQRPQFIKILPKLLQQTPKNNKNSKNSKNNTNNKNSNNSNNGICDIDFEMHQIVSCTIYQILMYLTPVERYLFMIQDISQFATFHDFKQHSKYLASIIPPTNTGIIAGGGVGKKNNGNNLNGSHQNALNLHLPLRITAKMFGGNEFNTNASMLANNQDDNISSSDLSDTSIDGDSDESSDDSDLDVDTSMRNKKSAKKLAKMNIPSLDDVAMGGGNNNNNNNNKNSKIKKPSIKRAATKTKNKNNRLRNTKYHNNNSISPLIENLFANNRNTVIFETLWPILHPIVKNATTNVYGMIDDLQQKYGFDIQEQGKNIENANKNNKNNKNSKNNAKNKQDTDIVMTKSKLKNNNDDEKATYTKITNNNNNDAIDKPHCIFEEKLQNSIETMVRNLDLSIRIWCQFPELVKNGGMNHNNSNNVSLLNISMHRNRSNNNKNNKMNFSCTYTRSMLIESLINIVHWVRREFMFIFGEHRSHNNHSSRSKSSKVSRNDSKIKNKRSNFNGIMLDKEWITDLTFKIVSMISFYAEHKYLTNSDFKMKPTGHVNENNSNSNNGNNNNNNNSLGNKPVFGELLLELLMNLFMHQKPLILEKHELVCCDSLLLISNLNGCSNKKLDEFLHPLLVSILELSKQQSDKNKHSNSNSNNNNNNNSNSNNNENHRPRYRVSYFLKNQCLKMIPIIVSRRSFETDDERAAMILKLVHYLELIPNKMQSSKRRSDLGKDNYNLLQQVCECVSQLICIKAHERTDTWRFFDEPQCVKDMHKRVVKQHYLFYAMYRYFAAIHLRRNPNRMQVARWNNNNNHHHQHHHHGNDNEQWALINGLMESWNIGDYCQCIMRLFISAKHVSLLVNSGNSNRNNNSDSYSDSRSSNGSSQSELTNLCFIGNNPYGTISRNNELGSTISSFANDKFPDWVLQLPRKSRWSEPSCDKIHTLDNICHLCINFECPTCDFLIIQQKYDQKKQIRQNFSQFMESCIRESLRNDDSTENSSNTNNRNKRSFNNGNIRNNSRSAKKASKTWQKIKDQYQSQVMKSEAQERMELQQDDDNWIHTLPKHIPEYDTYKLKEAIFDPIWKLTRIPFNCHNSNDNNNNNNSNSNKSENKDDEKQRSLRISDKSNSDSNGANLCCHIALHLLKLIRHTHHGRIRKMRNDMSEWIFNLLSHKNERIQAVAAYFFYLLIDISYVIGDSNVVDPFSILYSPDGMRLSTQSPMPRRCNSAALAAEQEKQRIGFFTKCIENLFDQLDEADDDDEHYLANSTFTVVIGSVGIFAYHKDIQFAILKLLLSASVDDTRYGTFDQVLAREQIMRIANYTCNGNVSKLILESRVDMFKWLCEQLTHFDNIMDFVANQLLKQNGRTLLNSIIGDLLPTFIMKQNLDVLDKIEEYIRVPKESLCSKYLAKILCDVSIALAKKEVKYPILQFITQKICNEDDTSVVELFSMKPIKLLYDLLHHSGSGDDEHRSCAHKAIYMVCKAIQSYKAREEREKLQQQMSRRSRRSQRKSQRSQRSNNEDTPFYNILESKSDIKVFEESTSEILGNFAGSILNNLTKDLQFNNSETNSSGGVISNEALQSQRRKVFRTLRKLTEFLGSRLPQFASKIISIYRMGLQDVNIRAKVLNAWHEFMNRLPGKALAQHFSQIVVSLLSIVDVPRNTTESNYMQNQINHNVARLNSNANISNIVVNANNAAIGGMGGMGIGMQDSLDFDLGDATQQQLDVTFDISGGMTQEMGFFSNMNDVDIHTGDGDLYDDDGNMNDIDVGSMGLIGGANFELSQNPAMMNANTFAFTQQNMGFAMPSANNNNNPQMTNPFEPEGINNGKKGNQQQRQQQQFHGALTQAAMADSKGVIKSTDQLTTNHKIAALLKYIIVDKRDDTEDHYHEIPILPDLPEFRGISKVINEKLGKQTLETKLKHVVSLISQESEQVACMALRTLLYIIQKQRKKFESTIIHNTRHEQLLRKLMNCLLQLSNKQKNTDLLKLCAECLGEIGAIDFATLHNNNDSSAMALTDDFDDLAMHSIMLGKQNNDDDEDSENEKNDENKNNDNRNDDDSDNESMASSTTTSTSSKKSSRKSSSKSTSHISSSDSHNSRHGGNRLTQAQKAMFRKNANILSKKDDDSLDASIKVIPKYINDFDELCDHIVVNILLPVHQGNDRGSSRSDVTRLENYAQWSITQILTVMGCTPDISVKSQRYSRSSATKPRGVKNWTNFSEDIQDILQPCLTQSFVLNDTVKQKDDELSKLVSKQQRESKSSNNNNDNEDDSNDNDSNTNAKSRHSSKSKSKGKGGSSSSSNRKSRKSSKGNKNDSSDDCSDGDTSSSSDMEVISSSKRKSKRNSTENSKNKRENKKQKEKEKLIEALKKEQEELNRKTQEMIELLPPVERGCVWDFLIQVMKRTGTNNLNRGHWLFRFMRKLEKLLKIIYKQLEIDHRTRFKQYENELNELHHSATQSSAGSSRSRRSPTKKSFAYKARQKQKQLDARKKQLEKEAKKLQENEAKIDLFNPCIIFANHYQNIGIFIVPYMLNELLYYPQTWPIIIDEFRSVIKYVCDPQKLMQEIYNTDNNSNGNSNNVNSNNSNKSVNDIKMKGIIVNKNNNNKMNNSNNSNSIDNDKERSLSPTSQKKAQFESIVRENQMCTQTIFRMCDTLHSWKRQDTMKKVKKPYADAVPSVIYSDIERNEKFFNSLPYLELSEAAYHCKAYARALKYFESYIYMAHSNSRKSLTTIVSSSQSMVIQSTRVKRRQSAPNRSMFITNDIINNQNSNGNDGIIVPKIKNANNNDGKSVNLSLVACGQLTSDELSLWQKIQAGTKEMDGMNGVAVFRMNTSLSESALDFECQGRWDKAMHCYERSIIFEQSNLQHHKGYLNSLLKLGSLDTVVQHVNGLTYTKEHGMVLRDNVSRLNKSVDALTFPNLNLDLLGPTNVANNNNSNNNSNNNNNNNNNGNALNKNNGGFNGLTSLSTAIVAPAGTMINNGFTNVFDPGNNLNNMNMNNNNNNDISFDLKMAIENPYALYGMINPNDDSKNNENKTISDEFLDDLMPFRMQALWRLQRWDILDDFLKSGNKHRKRNDFEFQLAECLSSLVSYHEKSEQLPKRNDVLNDVNILDVNNNAAFRQRNAHLINTINNELNQINNRFNHALDAARLSTMKCISTTHMESYHCVYPYLVQLHMLQELVHAHNELIQQNLFDTQISTASSMSNSIPAINGKKLNNGISVLNNNGNGNNININNDNDDGIEESLLQPTERHTIRLFDPSTYDTSNNNSRIDGIGGIGGFGDVSEMNPIKYVNNDYFWNERLHRTQKALSVREPILSLRRALYGIIGMAREESHCWLLLGKEARFHHQFSHSHNALFNCRQIADAVTFNYLQSRCILEQVRLMHSEGDPRNALMNIEKHLLDQTQNREMQTTKIARNILSKMYILNGDWMKEATSKEPTAIIEKYQEAVKQQSTEEAHFKLAFFLDGVVYRNSKKMANDNWIKWQKSKQAAINSKSKSNKSARNFQLPGIYDSQHKLDGIPYSFLIKQNIDAIAKLSNMLYHYLRSLSMGHKHIFQSLPRILTLWFDHGDLLIHETNLQQQNKTEQLQNSRNSRNSSGSRRHSSSGSRGRRGSNGSNSQSQIHHGQALKDCQWPSFFYLWIECVPCYQWMCVIPMLIARSMDDAEHTQKTVRRVFLKCTYKYPRQLFWMIALLVNYKRRSAQSNRPKKSREIIRWLHNSVKTRYTYSESQQMQHRRGNYRNNNNDNNNNNNNKPDGDGGVTSNNKKLGHLVLDAANNVEVRICDILSEMKSLLDALIQITPAPPKDDELRRAGQWVKVKCPKYLRERRNFFAIVPTSENLNPSLPSNGISNDNWNTYSEDPVCIHKFHEKFVTMPSAAQPKKITLIGTDGLTYSFLCKREHKGDMRKDQRMMEVCSVINRLLHGNYDSRHRNLNLHTYAVITIHEQVGMVQWVSNVTTLRSILNETHHLQELTKPSPPACLMQDKDKDKDNEKNKNKNKNKDKDKDRDQQQDSHKQLISLSNITRSLRPSLEGLHLYQFLNNQK